MSLPYEQIKVRSVGLYGLRRTAFEVASALAAELALQRDVWVLPRVRFMPGGSHTVEYEVISSQIGYEPTVPGVQLDGMESGAEIVELNAEVDAMVQDRVSA